MVLFADGCDKCQCERQELPSGCLLQPRVCVVNLVEEGKKRSLRGHVWGQHVQLHASEDVHQQRRYSAFRETAGELGLMWSFQLVFPVDPVMPEQADSSASDRWGGGGGGSSETHR